MRFLLDKRAVVSGIPRFGAGALRDGCALVGGVLLTGAHVEVLVALARSRGALALAARVPAPTAQLLTRMQTALEDEDPEHLVAEYLRLFVSEVAPRHHEAPVPPWIECYAPARRACHAPVAPQRPASGQSMNHVGLRLILALDKLPQDGADPPVRAPVWTNAWPHSAMAFGETLASRARRVFWREVGLVTVDLAESLAPST